jgi:hypothetical protein
MSTMTEDRDNTPATPDPVVNVELIGMSHCTRCNLSYLPMKSTSALRLTYCSFLCELGDLGFSIVGLEHMERVKKPVELPADLTPPAAEPAAVE